MSRNLSSKSPPKPVDIENAVNYINSVESYSTIVSGALQDLDEDLETFGTTPEEECMGIIDSIGTEIAVQTDYIKKALRDLQQHEHFVGVMLIAQKANLALKKLHLGIETRKRKLLESALEEIEEKESLPEKEIDDIKKRLTDLAEVIENLNEVIAEEGEDLGPDSESSSVSKEDDVLPAALAEIEETAPMVGVVRPAATKGVKRRTSQEASAEEAAEAETVGGALNPSAVIALSDKGGRKSAFKKPNIRER